MGFRTIFSSSLEKAPWRARSLREETTGKRCTLLTRPITSLHSRSILGLFSQSQVVLHLGSYSVFPFWWQNSSFSAHFIFWKTNTITLRIPNKPALIRPSFLSLVHSCTSKFVSVLACVKPDGWAPGGLWWNLSCIPSEARSMLDTYAFNTFI